MTSIAILLHYLIHIYIWIVILHGFIGFLPYPKSAFFQGLLNLIVTLVSPVLDFMHRKIKLNLNGLDLSPFVLIILLIVLDKSTIYYLSNYAL